MTLLIWWKNPRLASISLSDGSLDIQPNEPIRLTFSQPMNHGSVTERLSLTPSFPWTISWEEDTLTFSPENPWSAGKTNQAHLMPSSLVSGLLP